jgi:hypothetical protein
MTQDAIETHVASAVALIGAALAAVHPGFTLPNNTTALLASLLVVIAGGLQWLHKFQKAPKGQKLAVVESAASSVTKALEDGSLTKDVSTVKTTVGEVQVDAKDVADELSTPVAPPPSA